MPGKADERHLAVVVLVSGVPIDVTVNVKQKVRHLVQEALEKSGNAGQELDRWELRTADGNVMPMDARIDETQLSDGDQLTLQPQSGEGGRG